MQGHPTRRQVIAQVQGDERGVAEVLRLEPKQDERGQPKALIAT